MTVTTKAAFAAELNVTKTRVSQYVQAGLPVRSDGKLNREEALSWVAANQLSQTGEDKGGNRARRLVKQRVRSAPQKAETADDRLLDLACALIRNSGTMAARNALKVGASLQVAYALDNLTALALGDVADDFLNRNGFPNIGKHGVSAGELAGLPDNPIDWQHLARTRGEPFDEEEAHALVDAIVFPPGWKPPADSPAALLTERQAQTEGAQ